MPGFVIPHGHYRSSYPVPIDRAEARGVLGVEPLTTVIALFPLASHGGPLWEPLCYAQIGGLSVATFITLLLVPVIYSIFVLDLKLIKWDATHEDKEMAPEAAAPPTVDGEATA